MHVKVLHTSDWHIGHNLYGRKCTEEHRAFLNWLADTLVSQKIDILLVAGDIFDTSTPSNRSLELYYSFLCRVAESDCRHVVITSGNHDSPSVLNAPREVLRFLDIHIVGNISNKPEDEVLTLCDQNGEAELLVCAVPFLRDRDIREAVTGESLEEKSKKLVQGITKHYRKIGNLAQQRRAAEAKDIPIVAMGHLFTRGAVTSGSDGLRDLYVGNLAHVAEDVFPDCIDYLALGHLHIPQKVGGSDFRRYSGSPLPMGFGEAGQTKSVQVITFTGSNPDVGTLNIPSFLLMESIHGDLNAILSRLDTLVTKQEAVVVEVIYEGEELVADLQPRLQEVVEGSSVQILRTVNPRVTRQILERRDSQDMLSRLSPHQVFDRCLDVHSIPAEQRRDLQLAFQETVHALEHDTEEDSP